MKAFFLVLMLAVLTGCATKIQPVTNSPFLTEESPSFESTIGYMLYLLSKGSSYKNNKTTYEGIVQYNKSNLNRIHVNYKIHIYAYGFVVPRPGFTFKLDKIEPTSITHIRNSRTPQLPYAISFHCRFGERCGFPTKSLLKWRDKVGLQIPPQYYTTQPNPNLTVLHGNTCPYNEKCRSYDRKYEEGGQLMISFNSGIMRDEFLKSFKHLVSLAQNNNI